jgi:hypothetical protein
MASKTLCARSTVILWYSLRSSRETWASLTLSFSANSLWLRPLAILKAMSRVPTAVPRRQEIVFVKRRQFPNLGRRNGR